MNKNEILFLIELYLSRIFYTNVTQVINYTLVTKNNYQSF